MITRKISLFTAVTSLNMNIEKVVFDNIKACHHLRIFFWFGILIESVSIVFSLLTAAARMLKADFFIKKIWCSLCACNNLFFNLFFCSWGGLHLEQKWKAFSFLSLNQMPGRFHFLNYFKNVYYFRRQKQGCYQLVLTWNCMRESEYRNAPEIVTCNSHFSLISDCSWGLESIHISLATYPLSFFTPSSSCNLRHCPLFQMRSFTFHHLFRSCSLV